MIDLNSKHAVSDRINHFVDAAIAAQVEKPRGYLGASIVGHQCEKAVQYHYLAALGEVERKQVEPRIKRIFDRGNLYEDRAISWLEQAGFVFGGHQNEFSDFDGAFSGHCDGIITAGPDCGISYPCLWECKCLGAKGFNAAVKHGLKWLKDEKQEYWWQTHLYGAYMGLDNVLFTIVCADTMELHHLHFEVNLDVARQARQRVQRVINSTDMGEMVPRCTSDRSYYLCKFCDFFSYCWK